MIAALGLFFLGPVAAAAAEEPCNGSVLLCDRTLDKVVLPGTHNSMSNSEDGWNLPNQTYNISNQLNMGVRALLFDTYYGEADVNGTVTSIPKSQGHSEGAQTFMCHALCQLGSVDLTAELSRIKDFLAANPREVLMFINEDYIHPDDFATAVESSGLFPYIYDGPVTDFPTLGQMIDSGKRVVAFSQGNPGSVSWYHDGYDGPIMETPYTFVATPEHPTGGLTDPALLDETCKPERGSEGSPLFLMNHWVTTGVTPDIEKMALVNTREALVSRARACETRRGKLPTILAVDFFGTGDVIGAVRTLNGVPDPIAPPEPVSDLVVFKPKTAKVKAGKKAKYAVRLDNIGTADATTVKVCAKAPARLARKKTCLKVGTVAASASKTVKLKIKTKKRYRKGAGTVKFAVSSSEATLATSAKLKVKPVKKPKKRKKQRK
ncbi:MAG: hypothetical protein WBW62_06185 [Solirubrobacterales bacterium]